MRVNRKCSFLPDRLGKGGEEELLQVLGEEGILPNVVGSFRLAGMGPFCVLSSMGWDLGYAQTRLDGEWGLLSARKNVSVDAGGKGISLPSAFLSAVGEYLERIFGSVLSSAGEIVYGSFRELIARGIPCIPPERVFLFSDEQYASPHGLYRRFEEKTHLGWKAGVTLLGGKSCYYPAQLVDMGYLPRSDEGRIGFATSAGLACHSSWEAAVAGAICELFEKDAVGVSWVSRLPLKEVILDEDGVAKCRPILAESLRECLRAPGSISVFLHATDCKGFYPLSVEQRRASFSHNGLFVGAGGGMFFEEALSSAFAEYGQAEQAMGVIHAMPRTNLSKQFLESFGGERARQEGKALGFFDGMTFWGEKKNQQKLQWRYTDLEKIPMSRLWTSSARQTRSSQSLDMLKKALKRKGWDPILFDFTPDSFQTIKIMRAVLPELVPHAPPQTFMYGHPRYRTMPVAMGLRDKELTFEELNKAPSPYP